MMAFSTHPTPSSYNSNHHKQVWHHHRQGWADVDEANGKYFTPLVAFARQWLGAVQIQSRIKYNETAQRLDLQFRHQQGV